MSRSTKLAIALMIAAMSTACAAETDTSQEDPGATGDTSQDLGGFDRHTVYNEVKGNADAPGDLLRTGFTDDKLVAAIGWMKSHGAPAFYISAIRSDHHNDGAAAHAGGHCADMYATNGADAKHLIHLASQNPYVHEIGLGGAYKAYRSSVTKSYFNDNNATHLHIGTIHAFGN